MSNKKPKGNSKPNKLEIAEIVIKAVVAAAALITAIKWW